MNMVEIDLDNAKERNKITRKDVKRWAKEVKEETGMGSSHAHEFVAKKLGYNSYNHFLKTVGEIK